MNSRYIEKRDETIRDAIATVIQTARHTTVTSYEIADKVIETQTIRAAQINAQKPSDLSEKR